MTINNSPESEAVISFEQNTTKPTPPEVPGGGEMERPNEGETGMVGPLTIDYITKINFGPVKVSGNDATYFAELAKIKLVGVEKPKDVANYVQITDSRGSNAGWQLQLQQADQFTAKDEQGKDVQLTGAKLTFANPTLKSSQKDAALAPLGIERTLVPGSGPVTVVNAASGKGMGTWHYTLGDTDEQAANSVSLNVPGDTAKLSKVSYKTTLVWTLVDAPTASDVTPEQTP